jgi:ribonuclease Z
MFKVEIKSDIDEDICILIKVENHSYNYICECGEARKLGVKDCQNTNAIFLSHTHIDHFVNFDTILRHQIGVQRTVTIVGPKGIINQVQNRIKSYCWNLIEEGSICYEVREILGPSEFRSIQLKPPFWEIEAEKKHTSDHVFTEKDFHVEFEILDHKTDSISYLFKGKDKVKIELPNDLKGGKWVRALKTAYEENDTQRLISLGEDQIKSEDLFQLINVQKGKRLGIIMDHAANKSNHDLIVNRFVNCDTVFIESFYKDEDKEFAEKNFHSYASESGKIMMKANVKEAIPVHFSRKYEKNEIEELITQFENAKNKTT